MTVSTNTLMKNTHSSEQKFLELLNTYPSPHNGQPMFLRPMPGNQNTYQVFFDVTRGLTATPISYLFSFVTVGVFFRHSELCAAALGHGIHIDLTLPSVDGMAGSDPLLCGEIMLNYDTTTPDSAVHEALLRRQTSRKKYTGGLSQEEQGVITDFAKDVGLQLRFLDDQKAHDVIWLNQRAVFDDMFNPAVREELQHWLRFSKTEKETKRDGLSYDCMELSGGALKFFARNYRLLHLPVMSNIIKSYYLRTMRDTSSVGYVLAPFSTEQDAYTIGQLIATSWEYISERDKYLHPFGTIVANDTAHADFVRLVGANETSVVEQYVVFIFRAGSSEKPVQSLRLPVDGHLVKGEL